MSTGFVLNIPDTMLEKLKETDKNISSLATKINGAEDLMNDLGIPLRLIGNKANIITAQGKLEG